MAAVTTIAADPPGRDAPEALDADYKRLLSEAQLFRNVTPADVDAVIPSFSLRELPRREKLFTQGEDTPGLLCVLLSCSLAVTRRTPSGQVRTTFVGPGETVGELSVLDPGPRASTATATINSQVAVLDGHTFLTWCPNRPYLAERLLRVLARRLRRSDDATLDLLFVDIGARLAAALLDITQRFPAREPGGRIVAHGLTQQELGQLIGSSRQTVNKQLQRFAEHGWIEQSPGGILVLDPAQLAAAHKPPHPRRPGSLNYGEISETTQGLPHHEQPPPPPQRSPRDASYPWYRKWYR